MLIVALVLAVIGLAALVTSVATSNELIAWVCIGASGLGVFLLIIDAVRDRSHRRVDEWPASAGAPTEVIPPVETTEVIAEKLSDETASTAEDFDEDLLEDEDLPEAVEDHPDELVHDDPDYDTPSDDEPDFPEPAEEAAVHTVSEEYLAAEEAADLDDETGDVADDVADGDADDAAIEVHYVASAGDSATTVVYTYAEETETQYVEAGDPQVEDQQHDQ